MTSRADSGPRPRTVIFASLPASRMRSAASTASWSNWLMTGAIPGAGLTFFAASSPRKAPRRLHGQLVELADDRRDSRPRDDLLRLLIHAEGAGRRLRVGHLLDAADDVQWHLSTSAPRLRRGSWRFALSLDYGGAV